MFFTNPELYDYDLWQRMEQWFAQEIDLIMSGEKHLSYSALSKFCESPLHFKRYKINKKFFPEDQDTKAMEEGKIFHMCLLEPEKFMKKYMWMDDSDIVEKLRKEGSKSPRSTKKYKEEVAKFLEARPGMEVLKKEDWQTYMAMSYAANKHIEAGPILKAMDSKESKFEYEHNGFKLLGFYDGEGSNYNGAPFTGDAKKIASLVPKKLKWEIYDRRYHLQGGLYSLARNSRQHFLIFVDKSINVQVVQLENETLDDGIHLLETTLQNFEDCAAESRWNEGYEYYNGGLVKI